MFLSGKMAALSLPRYTFIMVEPKDVIIAFTFPLDFSSERGK